MTAQMSIDFTSARADGERAAEACLQKAQRGNPEFSERARAAILNHLRVVKQASGEDLTDIAIASGARCHDARAMGSVFAGLSRAGLIRTVGYCERTKGNGTAGGRIWALCK